MFRLTVAVITPCNFFPPQFRTTSSTFFHTIKYTEAKLHFPDEATN